METRKSSCSASPSGCSTSGGAGHPSPDDSEQTALNDRMRLIRHKIVVLSGKGGVGKSTVAANLAVSLALAGKRVGLLDVDIHGPSIPRMLKLQEPFPIEIRDDAIQPAEKAGIKVMSVGFLLKGRDEAVIWRGPLKMSLIKQFLKDVEWGELDYLIIDSPPGTGDEPLSVCQLVQDPAGAVVVTTPQDVATADVRKSVNFCKQLGLPVLGVVENMSGFVCPKCGEVTDIFKSGGGERMAGEMGVPFLGRIPIDPDVGRACDSGTPFVYHFNKTETARAFERVIAPILALSDLDHEPASEPQPPKEGDRSMKIAIPLADGKLCAHFGHCEQFALLTVNADSRTVAAQERLTPPPHEPGLLPRWLHEKGATHIIAGGMGSRAQGLFRDNGIQVVVGAPADEPERLAAAFLAGTLKTGANVCEH